MKKKLFMLLALVMTAMTASAYDLTVGTNDHGTIAFTVGGETRNYAVEKEVVTVTITPEDGWATGTVNGKWYAAGAAARTRTEIELLKDITLTPVSGQNNQWTFTMARANVEISATYKKIIQTSWVQDISAVTYSGSQKRPTVTVKDGTTTLVLDTDYSVTYSNNVNAGTATATITGKGNYSGTVTKNFTINKASGSVTFNPRSVTKTYGDGNFTNTCSQAGNGSISYSSNNTNVATVYSSTGEVAIKAAGTARITATMASSKNYTSATSYYTLTVEPKTLTEEMIGEIAQQTYTGGPLTPEVVVKDGNTVLVENTDYTVTYSSNTNAALATATENAPTVTITGKGNYKGSVKARFSIVAADAKLFTLTLEPESFVYDGQEKTPAVIVKDGETILVEGTDYTLTYANNVHPGTATVTATGMGNYSGTKTATFTIDKANGSVVFSQRSFEKTFGDADFTILPTVTGDGSLTYISDNEKVAIVDEDTGMVTIKGVGKVRIIAMLPASSNYTNSGDWYEVTVSPKALTEEMIGEIAQQTYTGGPLTPAVVVSDGQTVLVENTDYTVAFENNTEPGEATVTVTGMGNYTESASATFTIVSTIAPDTDDEAAITIGATGKSTFVSTRDVDFTESGAEAYIAVGYNATEKLLTLGRIYKVPAGTPVLVKGAQGVFNVPFTSGVTYEYKNLFTGNATGKTVEIGENSDEDINYVLKQGEFQTVVTNAYVPNGKAYLHLPATYPAVKPGSALNLTLPASGKSTLCSSVDLDFSNVAGMKAYAATGYDKTSKTVMLSRVLKASAGTPLVLHGKSNAAYSVPSPSEGIQTSHVNMLVGNNSGAAITVDPTSDSMVNYYLSSGEFKAVVDYVTVPDGKAYLQLPDEASARAVTRGAFDDYQYEMNDQIILIRLSGTEATGIDDLLKAAAEQDAYYNLNGQRTENPRKGIYLQRGRKDVIK